MFAQVIHGRVVDADAFMRQTQRWADELRPGASGFLGSTGGITADGRFVVVARFESGEAARANSDRPEQGAWWSETEKAVSDVEFYDCTKVTTMMGGGADDAGFVQVMRGRITNPAKMAEIESRMSEFEATMKEVRPDVLGDVIAEHGDGTYTDVVYFTSEAEARAGEQHEMPAEAQAMMGDLMSAIEITDYLDLRQPMFLGPR